MRDDAERNLALECLRLSAETHGALASSSTESIIAAAEKLYSFVMGTDVEAPSAMQTKDHISIGVAIEERQRRPIA